MHTRAKMLSSTAATALALAALSTFSPRTHAAVDLIAIGSLGGSSDLSGLTGLLENGVDHGNVLGGMGSGLAWAGGSTFLALPDRGPNATSWNAALDNTTSYLSRFQTVNLQLTPAAGGSLPFTLTPTLTGTTLLSSPSALNYGGLTPAQNSAGKFYFSGRSDNFLGSGSTNPDNARLDPEAIRVSNDGRSVFVSDEYGPYVYRFDRFTGSRTATYTLPSTLAIGNLSPMGATEISGNSSGRVANKGMEGLAITPDGSTLVGFMQSPLIQDGGDGGRANRLVTIDVNSGTTHQYAYDNFLTDTNKAYNSSEILALNDHEFLVLERDGKGLGDGSNAAVKRIYKIDLAGATDVTSLSGEANLLGHAVSKTLFVDLKANLGSHGIGAGSVPAKLEGMAFGSDVMIGGTLHHTLYVANDNDFLPGTSGGNNFYVFAFTDADLGGSVFQNQSVSSVPEPAGWALMLGGLALVGFAVARRRRRLAVAALAMSASAGALAAPGGVLISEWMYNPVGSPGEFVEITNFGPSAVDLAGWSFDDNSRQPGSESLAGFGLLQPGQSVVFTEASAASFRSAWNLPASVQVIGGIANNLGRSDEINLYNGTTLVDRLTFNDQGSGSVKGPRTQGVSGVPASLSALGTNNASAWVLSAVGNADHAYASVGGDIGSPGFSAFAPAVPEPGVWAMLVAGLGVVGLDSRRRPRA